MITYTIRRLLQSLIVVWAATTLMFVLFFIIPGDPISLKSGEKALPPEILANITEKYGLDQPVTGQYFRFWNNLLHGDLGFSYKNFLKPILFRFDAENIHDVFINIGESISNNKIISYFT